MQWWPEGIQESGAGPDEEGRDKGLQQRSAKEYQEDGQGCQGHGRSRVVGLGMVMARGNFVINPSSIPENEGQMFEGGHTDQSAMISAREFSCHRSLVNFLK